jgi:hypothetical protein
LGKKGGLEREGGAEERPNMSPSTSLNPIYMKFHLSPTAVEDFSAKAIGCLLVFYDFSPCARCVGREGLALEVSLR